MLHPFLGVHPTVPESTWIAHSADVSGDVVFGEQCSVWFNVTIRGDVHWVRIGDRTNIQDNAVVHVTNRTSPTRLGDDVTVGHSAVVHGCTVQDRVLVGIGAVILDDAVIGHDSLVGARALVTGGVEIPPRSLVLGAPARVVRELTDEEVDRVAAFASNYVTYSRIYMGVDSPAENPWYDRGSAPER
ncbi:MAG: gamma carbonic anhydrase family protein [Rhodothermales bacterium]|nr:gamma carbonic anhydrase family protein [Rhodothermales bacterium]MBO6779882.1 gamma carbonic anhydrase family protein [Rhodothermales bacterium]